MLLVDGVISIHDYTSFEPKMQLHKAKGTSYFATDLKARVFFTFIFPCALVFHLPISIGDLMQFVS